MTMFCESFPMHLRTQFNKLHYIRFFNFHTGQESWGDYVIGGLRAPSGHAWLDRKVPTVRLSGAKSRNEGREWSGVRTAKCDRGLMFRWVRGSPLATTLCY